MTSVDWYVHIQGFRPVQGVCCVWLVCLSKSVSEIEILQTADLNGSGF